MPRFEMAIWHGAMSLEDIKRYVQLEPKIGWSRGDKDANANRHHDRTYARFCLVSSWHSPHFNYRELQDHFSSLLTSSEFNKGGRSALYITLEDGDVEVLIGTKPLDVLSRLGVELVLR